MGKILSERERKLQKKLIPLNIFVCILALTAAFSLLFAPILKIDFGKILRNESMIEYVDKTIDNALGDSMNGESGESGENEVDFMPVISAVVSKVLSSAEGAVNFSAYGASKVAFSAGDDKANKVLDELFFGDNALVTKLIDSVADNIVGMFNEDEGKELIEEVVVSTIATSLVAGLSGEAAEKITEENITTLTTTFKKFDDVSDSEGAGAVADEFVDQLDTILGDDFDKEKDGEAVRDYIMNMYEDTAEEAGEFSVEAMISVAVSKNVDLNGINIGDLFGGGNNGGNNEEKPATAVKRAVDGEIEGVEGPDDGTGEGTEPPAGGDNSGDNGDNNEGEQPSGGENGGEVDPPEGGDNGGNNNNGGETPEGGDNEDNSGNNGGEVTPPEGGSGSTDEDRVICTSYSELLAQMGLDENQMDELKANLKTTLQNLVNDSVGEFSEYFGYYGYVFYGMLAFVVPWFVLFLFAFFHIFAKNKRFTMWYVKLYSFIPGLISLALLLAPKIISTFFAQALEGETGPIIKALLGGVSSLMWISGICYILLWLASIFWAFPIKRKIRKERKLMKNGGGSYYDDSYGDSYDGGKKGKKQKKNKKAAKNGEYSQPNPYGNPYGGNPYDNGAYANPYGSNPYGGDPYGNPYGGSPYGGDPYGSNPYGGSPYGSPYGDSYGSGSYGGSTYGGSYDDDDDSDGFDSPYTGGYYGSSYDDDDL